MQMKDAKKLIRLAVFLENLPPERFNFRHIVDSNTWEGHQNLSCGTTACAIGWCPTIWPKHLKLVPYEDYKSSVVVVLKNEVPESVCPSERDTFKSDISKFFGITAEETRQLFQPGVYCDWSKAPFKAIYGDASAKRVAEHIREFVMYKLSEGN